MGRLIHLLKPYWIFALLGPLAIIGEVMLEIRIPLLMADIVDEGIPGRDITLVLQTGGWMIVMALVSLMFGAAASFFSSRAAMGLGAEVRRAQFNKVQEFSFSNIDRLGTGSLITRLTTDVNNLQNAVMMSLRMLVRAPVMLVSATILAYTINHSLVTVFFAAVPFLAVCMAIIMTMAFPRFSAMLTKFDTLNASIQENLIGMRVVKAFVRARHEKEKFREANDSVMHAQMRAERVVIFGMPLMMITMYASIIAIMWFGGNLIIDGRMLTGELMSFISYVTQILMSLMMISMVFITLVISRASVGRIIEVLSAHSDITNEGTSSGLAVENGDITFENVSFKYNKTAETNTLEGISFSIRSGETVGIIGGTGSAKTSLVQLIPRLYDVSDGRVLVAGHDVRDYPLNALRGAIGMVLQNNVLFSGPIIDNLRWGDQSARNEDIEWAAGAAQAHDFITSFPDGYNTQLGQGGVNVSGGQKQRLCIARAMLKRPRILILDDSTSAVDTATDARIRASFSGELKDATKIIIAQRIASVREADKIIVLDNGHISDIGSHDELFCRSEIYKEVFLSQQKGVAQ
ncbi:MAG: ABC transporter ATP-binding protein [Acetanaerobacterium sp.]